MILWQAYEELEPAAFDDWKHDVRFARLMCFLAHVIGGEDAKDVTLQDFLPPELKPPPETAEEKAQRQLREFKAARAKAMGEPESEFERKRRERFARLEAEDAAAWAAYRARTGHGKEGEDA